MHELGMKGGNDKPEGWGEGKVSVETLRGSRSTFLCTHLTPKFCTAPCFVIAACKTATRVTLETIPSYVRLKGVGCDPLERNERRPLPYWNPAPSSCLFGFIGYFSSSTFLPSFPLLRTRYRG